MLELVSENPFAQRLEGAMIETNDNAVLQSFEATALPHLDDLFRTATSLLGNRTEAEDAVQECYLQAWKSFHRFTPGTNCRAWLFKILFHVVSHHRRKWLNRFRIREDPGVLEMAVATPSVPVDLTDEEIIGALQKIPQQYAEVLLLADVQEFSYKEIQDTLGIPIGTVMSRLSRGRHLLRNRLAHLAPTRGPRRAAAHAG